MNVPKPPEVMQVEHPFRMIFEVATTTILSSVMFYESLVIIFCSDSFMVLCLILLP